MARVQKTSFEMTMYTSNNTLGGHQWFAELCGHYHEMHSRVILNRAWPSNTFWASKTNFLLLK
jgi:hypothetical protein